VLPEGFLDEREIILVQQRFSPFEPLDGGNLFEYVVTYNLTGDRDSAILLQNPMSSVVLQRLAPPPGADEAPDAAAQGGQSLAPMAMLFIFFFVLTMSSGYVLTSVTKEKESRIVEVLLSSIKPRELMLGKLVGLSAVALLQMAIWLGGGLLVLREGSPIFGMASALLTMTFPPGFAVWALLYFLLGYVMFASALAAIGTLAPNAREGSQFTFLVLLPLMIPMWLNTAFVEAPKGALVTFLSIFPLTSPVSMIARMAAVTVPLWQILLSLALLIVTAYGLVLLSARLFSADTLLSGAPISFQRLREGLRRRTV
jgi:ABC-2 type transport system permease protein